MAAAGGWLRAWQSGFSNGLMPLFPTNRLLLLDLQLFANRLWYAGPTYLFTYFQTSYKQIGLLKFQ